MTVTLRQRKKGNKISLYLDYYNEGKRDYEYLQLYLIPEPEKGKLTREQKEENRKTIILAEAIRSKRLLQIKNEEYGFRDTEKGKGSFIAFFERLTEKRKGSKGNWGNWDSVLKHLKKFDNNKASLKDIDKNWLENFKNHLQYEVKSKTNKSLSQNSQSSYFNKIVASLKEAVKEGIIQSNPANQVEGIKADETRREFLTLEELQAVAKFECEIPYAKNRFPFQCIDWIPLVRYRKIGLVRSAAFKEVRVLHTISDRRKLKKLRNIANFRASFLLLGERGKQDDKVFEGLYYSAWHNLKLREWVMKGGITKHVTFHCARHTYATLQINIMEQIFTLFQNSWVISI
jgi:integrase